MHAGALLTPEEKQSLSRINQELASLFSEFNTKVLAEERGGVVIERESDLEGVPAALRQSFQRAAGSGVLSRHMAHEVLHRLADDRQVFLVHRTHRAFAWYRHAW